MPLPHALRSLRHRNFSRFFLGQAVSLIGSWMQSVAIMWLAYRISGSTGATGTVGFLALIPYLVVTPIAGVLADRVSRRKLLMVVQSILVVHAVTLTSLTLLGHMTVSLLGIFAVVLGTLNAIEVTTRHSFFVHLIDDKTDLPNAIALNSAIINGTRLIGPALGGLVIAALGEAACFGINAVSYLAVLVSLSQINPVETKPDRQGRSLLADLGQGWRFALGDKVIRVLLITVGIVSFTISPYTILMPAISVQAFGRGAELNGMFLSAVGLGALIGAVLLAARPNVRGLSRWIMFTTAFAALGAMGFALLAEQQIVWLSLLCMALTGMGMMGTSACVNTIIQTVVHDELRGRVVSVYSTFFTGAAPLGHLAAGWLAEHIGAPRTFLVCGIVCALGALYYAIAWRSMRWHLRDHYVKRGIIPASDTPAQ